MAGPNPSGRAYSDDLSAGGTHPDNVVAAVHMMDLAGDPGRQITEQIQGATADLIEPHIAANHGVSIFHRGEVCY